jgi:hypothetical protein
MDRLWNFIRRLILIEPWASQSRLSLTPPMKFSQILEVLQTNNEQWRTAIEENTGIRITGPSKDSSVKGQPPEDGCDCFCGLLKGQPSNIVTLSHRAKLLHPSGLVGVLNVADSAHSNGNPDLPVVVCCGINYGQIGTLAFPVGLASKTGMTGFVKTAVSRIQAVTGCKFPFPDKFHLVATNVFPWISISPWLQLNLNYIEEAMLIHCLADGNPSLRIARLIQALSPSAVLFHGAGNCVSAYANHSIQHQGFKDCEVIYCDNLSGRSPFSNAIRLCNCHGTLAGCPPKTGVSEDDVADLQE